MSREAAISLLELLLLGWDRNVYFLLNSEKKCGAREPCRFKPKPRLRRRLGGQRRVPAYLENLSEVWPEPLGCEVGGGGLKVGQAGSEPTAAWEETE